MCGKIVAVDESVGLGRPVRGRRGADGAESVAERESDGNGEGVERGEGKVLFCQAEGEVAGPLEFGMGVLLLGGVMMEGRGGGWRRAGGA